MNVRNVKLHLKGGGTGGATVLAPSQHVYLDLDPSAPGTMQHLRSDSTGTLVAGAAGAGGPATLDDSRIYTVVVSASPLASPPATGERAQVAAGKLVIPAHIAILVTSDGTRALGGAACQLTIGSTTTSVTTTPGGFVLSSDRSPGAVTLTVSGRFVSATGGAAPSVALTIAPPSPVRGDRVKITAASPAGAVGFGVTSWRYDISHQNPGATGPATATVTRPAAEAPGTFGTTWEGILCASGTVRARWAAGVTLRASGDAAVSATVTARDSAEATLAVTVQARTGSAWASILVENAEASLRRAINTFHDTGHHGWNFSGRGVETMAIAEGPNRGCTFVRAVNATFTSSPSINSLLTDASSAFSRAQDTAYLVAPPPVRAIPRHLYRVGSGGALTIADEDAFTAWVLGRPLRPGESVNFRFSGHCIDQPGLLAGTRRHEHKDADKSHKANCLKARRALDPAPFCEALVRVPGATVDFARAFQGRVDAIMAAGPTHDVVDEAESRRAGALRFKPGAILGVNLDDAGAVIGPVWNPATQSELAN